MGVSKRANNCDDNYLANVFDGMMKNIQTAMPVKVLAVDTNKKTIKAQPMVKMVDANGTSIDYAPLHNVPYIRIQGGSYGLICDPVVGDMGIIVFCSRDISNVVSQKKSTLPASGRTHDIADGIYIASICLDEPETYLKVENDKVSIQTKQFNVENETTSINTLGEITVKGLSLTINAPTVDIVSPKVTITGDLNVTGDVKSGNISLKDHTHTNGNNGDNTGKPV